MARWVLWLALIWAIGVVNPAGSAVASETATIDFTEELSSSLHKQQLALAELFRLAELRNPALAAGRAEIGAGEGRERQAGLYPNPSLEFEVEELSTRDPDVRTGKVSIAQPLVLSGRRGDAVASARAERESSEFELRALRRAVLRRVHVLWAEHHYLREAEAALDSLVGMTNRTLEIARTRYDAQAAPESHVTKALLEVYDLEVTQRRLERERVSASSRLTALLGGTEVPPARLHGSLDTEGAVAVSHLSPSSMTDHPAALSAEKRIDAARSALHAAKAERLQDLGIFFSYGRSEPANEDFVEAGISIPLPLFDRNQGRIAETEALVGMAEDHARAVEAELQADLAAAASRHLTLRDELQAAEGLIAPAAERGLSQAQAAYRVGRLPFLELIDAQRTLANIRLRVLELKRDLIVTNAELLSLGGLGLYRDEGEEQ